MSSVLWPKIPGLHWEMNFEVELSNLEQKAEAPGFRTAISLGPDPIFHFDLTYNWMRQAGSQAGTPATDELWILVGFFCARNADFDPFLIYLPDLTQNTADGVVAGQTLTPDGNNVAPLITTFAGYNLAIYEAAGVNGNPLVTGAAAPVIKKDGTPLTAGTDYTIQGPGYAVGSSSYGGLVIVFSTTTAGHTITADFAFYFRVKFKQSSQKYRKFLALLYDAQTVQIEQTRN